MLHTKVSKDREIMDIPPSVETEKHHDFVFAWDGPEVVKQYGREDAFVTNPDGSCLFHALYGSLCLLFDQPGHPGTAGLTLQTRQFIIDTNRH
ncbi:hypothetical protein N9S30_00545, partial [bacterium]|nr:hypothetical protein [bacterium]